MFGKIQGIFSFLRKRISEVSVEAREQEKPATVQDLYEIYATCPPLFRVINIRATLASKFFELSSDNEEELKRVINTLSPVSGMAILRNIVYKASVDADIYGLGAVEMYLNGEMRPSLAVIHSSSIDFKRDGQGRITYKNGKPEAIIQKLDFDEVEIPFENVSLLRYSEVGDELYGLSLVKLCEDYANGYKEAVKGFGNAIKKLGYPIYDFSVGDEKHEVTPEVIEQVRKVVKNFADKKEFVHEHFIKPSITESKYISQSEDFDKPFIRAIAIASGIPEFLITGDTRQLSLASSRVMGEILPRILLPSLQNSIEIFIEDIFYKLAKVNNSKVRVNVIFKPVFSIDLLAATQRAVELSKIGICEKEELREIAGLPKTEIKNGSK